MPPSDRYELVDCVVEGSGWTLWRGRDSVLHRDVGIVVVAASHPRRDDVAEAARSASMVTDSRFLHLYDVADAGDDLWLVREWATGTDLVERLGSGPMRVEDACALGIQVAQALAGAHAQGVTHGALGPGDVLFTDDGRTKLAGLAIRVPLDATADGAPDPAHGSSEVEVAQVREVADSWAAAAVTYAAVTGRWPGQACDGLPGTPAGTGPTRAGQVRAGVPRVLDAALASALARPTTDPTEVATALSGVLSSVGRRAGDVGPDRPPRMRRGTARALAAVLCALVLLAVAAGALWLGAQLVADSDGNGRAGRPAATPTVSTPVAESPDATGRVEVVGGRDFDPDGNGEEESDLVPMAFDDNLATSWHTVSYNQPDMAPKSGVGVVFDLGRIETVGAVRLNLLGAGTALQVRVSRAPGEKVADFDLFGSGTNLGDLVALRAPEPVQARYVLVWLTRLPADGDTYRGGIAEIQVARS